MSADKCGRRRLRGPRAVIAAGALLALSALLPVQAWVLPERFDPLDTVPAVLGAGVVLPGDSAAFACAALPGTGERLDLSGVLDLALCHNPQVQAALAAVALRASSVGEARAASLPTLAATFSQLKNRTAYPDFEDTNSSRYGPSSSLNLSWRLLDFGGRRAGQDAASQGLLSALAGHEAAIQKMLSAVIRAYFEAVLAKSALDLKTQTVASSAAMLGSIAERQRKGVAAQGDVLQAKTVLLKDRLNAQRAEGDYQKALAALANGVGAPAGTALNLSEYVDQGDQPDSLRPAPDWLDFAQRSHPAIVSAQAQLAEVEKRVQVARSERLPSVDLTGSRTTNGTPGQALATRRSVVTTVGVVLNVPLFDGFSRTYKLRGALAQVELERAQLSEAVQQVRAQILQAHADAQAARLNLGASAELLTTAELSAATAARRYDKGAADIQELLGTQAALLQARQERLRCLVDWRSAYRQLLANAGVLGRSRAVSVAGDVLHTPELKLP